MIKRLLREVYLLPRGEQRALVFVSFLLILSVGIRIVVQLLPEREPVGMEQFEKESRALLAAIKMADSLKAMAHSPLTSPLFTNHQSPLTRPPASSSSASPRFTNQSPLTRPPASSSSASPRFTNHQSPIDINRADSVQLLPLRGIGPVFAGRIIRYRELLGGYVQVDQLLEVYGFPEETLDLVRDRLLIDASAVRKFNLDSASFRDLLRHPYLDLEDVKALVAYREFKPHTSTFSELKGNQVLPDSILERIRPYFKWD